ncbi:hypothetical protein E2C01_009878 [Portunus trituberculatus]|uniref:Uncharacterized protein n=1 Tax=Portunus trituberculatus TaxID=210409 RepID=A0A5B7D6W4_PORTR|nr:hypothetical protein [Portunus trituberculatus]
MNTATVFPHLAQRLCPSVAFPHPSYSHWSRNVNTTPSKHPASGSSTQQAVVVGYVGHAEGGGSTPASLNTATASLSAPTSTQID